VVAKSVRRTEIPDATTVPAAGGAHATVAA
jgi:hypothetical protein